MILARSRRRSGYAAVHGGGSRRTGHWGATRALAVTIVAIGVLMVVLPALFASAAADRQLLGMSFWAVLTSVGVPIGFVALVFAFAASQDAIDRAFRVSKSD